MPAKFELIAPCFFGCESTAKFELTRIGAENIRVDDGRLSFAGGAEMIAAANLNLRTVERVMLLLARYRAATFDDLFDGVYDIPWEELLPADAAFPVTGSSLNSQLSSVPACQSIIKKAVVKRLMAKHHTSVLPETGAEYKIRFMLRKDQCEIMLDTTGDGLHKRGYRRNAMEAPIREGMVPLVGFKSDVVTYERHERLAGESHYPLSKMLALAFDGITSLSNKPIRLITGSGIFVSLISFIGVIWAIVCAAMGSSVAGWASIVCIVCFMSGVQLVCLGVIGEYIGKIYMETKARPRYIISERTWAPYVRKYHG